MKQESIQSSRTAFYYSIGNKESPRDLWIVCHGYAQTADDFIKPFKIVSGSDSGVLAPEGLSRFYKSGTDGQVVSSWMTKRYRLSEIQDQIKFLNKLYNKYSINAERIHVLGFSQGVATIMRWLAHSQLKVDTMILWAGWPPEDIDYKSIEEYWDSVNTYYIYGVKDKYLTEDRIKAHEERSDLKVLKMKTMTFEGGHRLSRSVLEKLYKNIKKGQSTEV